MTGIGRPLAMVVVGARPNLVKVAPILRAVERDSTIAAQLVHTGQHYDPLMSEVFFEDLEITAETVNLGVGSGTHARQTGAIMSALEELMTESRPDIVITVGDVNSTVAAALVAAKAGVPQAHVEAGLRSGDAHMPEEVNRVVTDRLADLLFTHSEEAGENLRREGVARERVHFVGNVMIDTLLRLRPRWQGSATAVLGVLPEHYGVVTLHRPSNVDDLTGLAAVMTALSDVARRIPLIFPVHPRTRANLGQAVHPGVRLAEPLGYLGFLDLLEHARFALTDSGGIQEETTVLGVPCLTLRENTERPVTIRLGTNRLLGTDPAAFGPAVSDILAAPTPAAATPPLWDGHTGERIVSILSEWLAGPRALRLSA